jgi:hypothetical protein
MLQLSVGLLLIVAFGAWIFCFANAMDMFAKRDKAKSAAWFATHGIAFFSGEGFLPSAAPARRRFLIGALVFFASIIGGVALGLAVAPTAVAPASTSPVAPAS